MLFAELLDFLLGQRGLLGQGEAGDQFLEYGDAFALPAHLDQGVAFLEGGGRDLVPVLVLGEQLVEGIDGFLVLFLGVIAFADPVKGIVGQAAVRVIADELPEPLDGQVEIFLDVIGIGRVIDAGRVLGQRALAAGGGGIVARAPGGIPAAAAGIFVKRSLILLKESFSPFSSSLKNCMLSVKFSLLCARSAWFLAMALIFSSLMSDFFCRSPTMAESVSMAVESFCSSSRMTWVSFFTARAGRLSSSRAISAGMNVRFMGAISW